MGCGADYSLFQSLKNHSWFLELHLIPVGMFVIGSFGLERVEVISVTSVTSLSERRLKKTLSTYFNKDTCTCVGTFTV